jgi:hypothetical protein
MKLNQKYNKLKHLSLLLVILSNLFIGVITERMSSLSGLNSNYMLMKNKNKKNLHNSQNKFNEKLYNTIKKNNDPSASATPPITSISQSSPVSPPGEPLGASPAEIPDMPIYFQGWVKYFRYTENGNEVPKMFFKNVMYEKQQQSGSDQAKDDKFGSWNIPSEKNFFVVIYQDTANFMTSRQFSLMSVADSLAFDFIKAIPEDDNYKGGVKDMGTFTEGSCFEVSTVKPSTFFKMTAEHVEPENGKKEKWLICSDEDSKKNELMNIIIKLKLKKQHSLGVFMSLPTSGNESKANDNSTIDNVVSGASSDKINDPNASPKDGRWIVLNNWTPCTLKCGGGLQYLQLMCIPPKDGGKDCTGDPIRTKPCNTQPCPSVKTMSSILPSASSSNPTSTIEKAIVKVMPISKRPQRYDKCYLKDGDALMVKNDASTSNFENLPKIPIRIVMNNKSISVFQDESLQSSLVTFVISTTVFTRVKGDNRCFILTGNNAKAQFCQLDASTGNFVDEWDYDFSLFKYQCKEKRETISLAQTEEKKLEKEFEQKVNQLKLDMVSKKANKVKEIVENKEEIKLEKKVEEAQAMTLQAIQKELKMEEMLEREEDAKERELEKSIQVQLEQEKKKNECLQKTIKEKILEDQMNLSKSHAEEAIAKIKEEAKKEIMIKRAEMKKRLEIKRLKNRRKITAMQNDIITVRLETAGRVQKIAKVGDENNCFNPTNDPKFKEKIEEYCQSNFTDNNAKFMDCINPESFCFVCCESEFGDLHIPEREKCYKDICEGGK